MRHRPPWRTNKRLGLLTPWRSWASSLETGLLVCRTIVSIHFTKVKSQMEAEMNQFTSRVIRAVLLLCVCLFAFQAASAQGTKNQLVITQVYLSQSNPSQNWIEVLNPSDRTLVLERFRHSHVRSINVLPDSTIEAGGMAIDPGATLVLCADPGVFSARFGNRLKCVAVPALQRVGNGGFLAARTKDSGESLAGLVRYGDPKSSLRAESIAGQQVVPLAQGANGYSRTATRESDELVLSDFVESALMPGLSNH